MELLHRVMGIRDQVDRARRLVEFDIEPGTPGEHVDGYCRAWMEAKEALKGLSVRELLEMASFLDEAVGELFLERDLPSLERVFV